jgi:17beta-estradiol 17-dehydrogenase / very-long-chain 3-oxoacyl-CoA reductase
MALTLENPLYYIGLSTVAYMLVQACQFVYLHIRTSSILRYKHGSQSWALITGASDGIGLGFARELCRLGFNVILLGHKPDELESARASLERQFPAAKVNIFVMNAITASADDMQNLVLSLKSLRVSILVNNVGGLPPMESEFRPLSEYSTNDIEGTINLNCRFATHLTSLLLPDLARNGPSLIINMSSGGKVGLPYQVIYCATKAFVASFTSALAIELKCEGKPIEVIAFTPGTVKTGGVPLPVSFTVASVETFVKAALAKVGCGLPVVAGYWVHAMQIVMLNSLPEWMRQKSLANVIKGVRKGMEKSK